MSDTLSALRCAGCNAPNLVDVGDGTVRCDYCDSLFAHPDRVCAKCGTVSDLDALDCPMCGHALRGLCPACNTPNPLQVQTCRRCGAALDLLASVAGRVGKTSADFLYQRGADATAIKQQEEEHSRERLAKMWQRDDERERQARVALAERQRQEKRLAQIAVVIAALIVIGFVLIFVLTRMG